MMGPLRKVLFVETYKHSSCPRNSVGRHVFTLECGHEISFKASEGMRKKVHCLECQGEKSNVEKEKTVGREAS